MTLRTLPLIAALTLAACVAAPRPKAPPPRPAPVVRVPPPPPAPADWTDRALTPGIWTYASEPRGSVARYGVAGAAPAFAIRCDRPLGMIAFDLPGPDAPPVPASITLRATTTAKTFATSGGRRIVPNVAPRDPILDAIAFSRGRFLVVAGGAQLVLPSWPEFTRVVEDCRG